MSKNSLHEGLKRTCPPGVDSSMKPRGGSVNSEPTRKSVAKNMIPSGERKA